MNLPAIQAALRERNMDAWLFYDHHHRDPIAYRVLGIPAGLMVTRRWFYVIPAKGEPVKLVHKIESGHLDTLPGSKRQYAGWQELFDQVKAMLSNFRDIHTMPIRAPITTKGLLPLFHKVEERVGERRRSLKLGISLSFGAWSLKFLRR